MAYYWLTPPSRAVFIISVFLALLALLVSYAHVAIPVVSTYTFETLLTKDFRSGAMEPLHATIEELANCPRCRPR